MKTKRSMLFVIIILATLTSCQPVDYPDYSLGDQLSEDRFGKVQWLGLLDSNTQSPYLQGVYISSLEIKQETPRDFWHRRVDSINASVISSQVYGRIKTTEHPATYVMIGVVFLWLVVSFFIAKALSNQLITPWTILRILFFLGMILVIWLYAGWGWCLIISILSIVPFTAWWWYPQRL